MKVCFWGDITGALTGNTAGGSELQVALIAKALARGGHEVVVIDFQTARDLITDDGIKVFRIPGWNRGPRVIRTFTHRLPQLYRCLKAQKADIYYCRMRDYLHIFAYLAAKKAKSKFILSMASDLDALGFGMRFKYYYLANPGGVWWFLNSILNEIIHPWLRRNSDIVFVQHEGQKEILRQKHISSIVFKNLIDLTKIPVISNPVHDDFVYVGWLDRRKGFAEFFELVEKSPMHTFKVIGPPRDKTGYFYYEKLKSLPNVILLGGLSHSDTLYHIANSKALISTSPMEGFPNIFIEAWSCGIPVISLYFDPGGVIRREDLGYVAEGNLEGMRAALNAERNLDEFSVRSKYYVEKYHVLNTSRIKKINNLFDDILLSRETSNYEN